ncbi:hypothetical protein L207DRAFT_640032 [Hyaloscypha variabilis F]|uniref:Uncharacterized protein n=1 Tax=Hyaloscypha variabilis (strain UAMH 11265 / GT02V1 / F) TaxID=1149755 RepID=A0A2J6R2R0_HYAVF|nr:hypothetical protein L207DRAFT_640032 [Hyaloscypha variabilis F]
MLFEHLDIVTATCLGLTNKHLYSILKSIHKGPIRLFGTVDISLPGVPTVSKFIFTPLQLLISKWIEPLVWAGHMDRYRFVTRQRLRELVAEEDERNWSYYPKRKEGPRNKLKGR